jgi:(1->4)-alpha-D-glucan 1-alpha-D-glucosylmutase
MDDGLPKLWLIAQALAARAAHPDAFGKDGCYEPLRAQGPRADHVVAFARGGSVLTAVPRLVRTVNGIWDGTTLALPRGTWRNALADQSHTGRTALADLFAQFPVALLLREPA